VELLELVEAPLLEPPLVEWAECALLLEWLAVVLPPVLPELKLLELPEVPAVVPLPLELDPTLA
jgi:hypothetical protein